MASATQQVQVRIVGADSAVRSLERVLALMSKIPKEKQFGIRAIGADKSANDISKIGSAGESAKNGIANLSSFAVAKFAIIADIAINVARKIGQAFTSVVKSAWDYATVLQKSEVSWNKLAGIDAPAIIKLMKDQFTKLPYPIEEVSNSLMMMYTSGIKLEDLPKTLQSIADTAGASTAPDALNRITRGLTQMVAKQRVTSEEMMQLNEAGVNGWDLLAKAIGKTSPEIRKMSEEGKLGLKEVMMLIDQLGKRYEGLAEQQAKATLKGQWQLLKNELTQGLAPAMEKLQKSLVPVVQYIRTNVVPSIVSMGERFANFVDVVVRNSDKMLAPFKFLKDAINGVYEEGDFVRVTESGNNLGRSFDYAKTNAGKLKDKIIELKKEFTNFFFKPKVDFSQLETSSQNLGRSFSYVKQETGELELNLDRVKQAGIVALGVLAGFGTLKIGMAIVPQLTQIVGLISQFGAMNVLSSLGSVLTSGFSGAITSALSLLNPISLIITAVVALIAIFVGFNIDKIMTDAKTSLTSFLAGFDTQKIVDGFNSLKETFFNVINEIGATASWAYSTFIQPIIDFLQPVISFIGWLFSTIIAQIISIGNEIMKNESLMLMVKGVLIAIGAVLAIIIGVVVLIVAGFLLVVGAVLWFIDVVLKLVNFFNTNFMNALKVVWQFLVDLFTNPKEAINNLKKNVSDLIEDMKKRFSGIVDSIKAPFVQAFEWIKNNFPKPPEWLTNPAGAIGSGLNQLKANLGLYNIGKSSSGTTIIQTTNNYYTTNTTTNINGGIGSLKQEKALSQRLAYLGRK